MCCDRLRDSSVQLEEFTVRTMGLVRVFVFLLSGLFCCLGFSGVLFLLFGRVCVFFLLFGRGPRPRPNSKKKRHRPNSKKLNTPPPLPSVFFVLLFGRVVFFFAVWAGWRVFFSFAVWADDFFCCLGVCSFFCCLGGWRVLFLLLGPGACFFFSVWAGCVFFLCCLGGGREFTHLLVCLALL